MLNAPTLAEIVANKTDIAPSVYLFNIKNAMREHSRFLVAMLKYTGFSIPQMIDLEMRDAGPVVHEFSGFTSKSLFLNQIDNICLDFQIPHIRAEDNKDFDLSNILYDMQQMQFGGVAFNYINDPYGMRPDSARNSHAKYNFEMRYGIKLSDIYISLYELNSTTKNSRTAVVDDFLVTENGKILTIYDNDLPYGARDSDEQYECHFRPVGCIDRGVPVRYIRTVDDNGKKISTGVQQDIGARALKKLCEFYRGYPTQIDFIIKTGLHEFTYLGYDRNSTNGNFFITNVRYGIDGAEPRYTIKKCDFMRLPKTINAIQRARITHFNKMYGARISG